MTDIFTRSPVGSRWSWLAQVNRGRRGAATERGAARDGATRSHAAPRPARTFRRALARVSSSGLEMLRRVDGEGDAAVLLGAGVVPAGAGRDLARRLLAVGHRPELRGGQPVAADHH